LVVSAAFCLAYAPGDIEFYSWTTKFGKVYSTPAEMNLRKEIFKHNLHYYEKMNKKPGQTATYGPDQFSDMTREEFAEQYLLKKFPSQNVCRWPWNKVAPLFSEEDMAGIPVNWDWRNKGAVTPVKNQQSCGSCWTFSTAENIEGQWFLAKNQLNSLSEQWIVDCSHACLKSEPDLCNGGCGGGLPWLAYDDIIANKFLTTEAAYPYTGSQGTCQNPTAVGAQISNWTAVGTDVKQIITFCYNRGPLSITLNADLLFGYSTGIITGDPSTCPNSGSDHAVLLIGYGTDATAGDYWIVKNSWGTTWGESGFFRIQSDQGLCGINACVTSATV